MTLVISCGRSQHGAFKSTDCADGLPGADLLGAVWHRNVEPSLREAYNSVYGLSLYGSLAFASLRTSQDFILIQTEV